MEKHGEKKASSYRTYKDKTPCSVTLDCAVYEEALARAKAEDRPFSNMINVLVKKQLELDKSND